MYQRTVPEVSNPLAHPAEFAETIETSHQRSQAFGLGAGDSARFSMGFSRGSATTTWRTNTAPA